MKSQILTATKDIRAPAELKPLRSIHSEYLARMPDSKEWSEHE